MLNQSASTCRRAARLGAIVLVVAAVSGCEKARETFGLKKSSPDEFAVFTRAPLKRPPDYRLRPPAPGTPRPQEGTTQQAARAVLVGDAQRDAADADRGNSTTGESALLARAGASNPDPTIRQTVDRESAVLGDNENGLVSRILFWQKKEPVGDIVDASKESRRLQENIALGDSVSKGPVPIIKRREKGLFEGIFN